MFFNFYSHLSNVVQLKDMNAIIVGCLVFSTFIFDIGVSYGCCGLFSTFILHLVVFCLATSCLQFFPLTLVDVRYVILYILLVCRSLIF
jgi:hypothetical protein